MSEACWTGSVATPIGGIEYCVTKKGLVRLWLPGENPEGRRAEVAERFGLAPSSGRAPAIAARVEKQVRDYFAGKRTTFDLPLDLRGTPFQVSVWSAVARVPFGRVVSYGDVAARVGKPGAFRAVGSAQNANPVPIVVPCHRVVGSSGSLVGYGGGLGMKEWLLQHEGLPMVRGKVASVPG